ncbi:unnamed protein product [Aureobasidium mustum]|uniref:Uncharacterized protein n=1 Tax=Aureobasidium mustum TaxID=2773714 RepID=A0A9N8K7D1_9PEZI|nr:unnamed protein product [Aureobasidium mustum]
MNLLSTLGVFHAEVLSGPRGSQSLQALNKSMIALRNKAVHRIRVEIHALRFWALSAVRLAKLLEDHEAAKQFSSLVSALEVEHDRMKVEKSKAEESLLATVKELTAKRAELDRVEREAMTAYEAAHKQLPARTSELGMSIDANIPLDYGFGLESKETSSAKPTSGVLTGSRVGSVLEQPSRPTLGADLTFLPERSSTTSSQQQPTFVYYHPIQELPHRIFSKKPHIPHLTRKVELTPTSKQYPSHFPLQILDHSVTFALRKTRKTGELDLVITS